jgi:hypothetical protein
MPARRTNAALTRTRRLEGLSDASFAIILTLLVLEIHRPSAAPGYLAQSLAREWPSYLAYAMAFINIGVTWLNHHHVHSQIEHTDLTLNWINLAILGTATLIPFPHGRPGRCLRRHQPRRPAGGSGALRRDRIPRNRGMDTAVHAPAASPGHAQGDGRAGPLRRGGGPAGDRHGRLRHRRGMRVARPAAGRDSDLHPFVAYYAATSTGTRARLLRAECTPTDGNAENPPAGDQASATA